MRPREVEYWDTVAKPLVTESGVGDNFLKRQFIGQFLLKCSWINERVLEIGVGAGVSAGMLHLVSGASMQYVGTEMSPIFANVVRKMFGLTIVETDVLELPEGKFTRILALDSLEHVHPDDREQGYRNISARLENDGLLFINMPCNRSSHDVEFDHGFDLTDLARLEKTGLTLVKYDRYTINYRNFNRDYAFVVFTK